MDSPQDKQTQKIATKFAPINSIDRTPKEPKPRRKHSRLKRSLLLLGFIIVLCLAGILIYRATSKSETSTSNQVKSVLSDDAMKDYTSPENHFTIKMPGFPSIASKTYKDGEHTVPLTTYQRRVADGQKLYTFEVHDYSAIKLDEKKTLESKLNSTIQNTPGAKLTSSQAGVYSTFSAIEADYMVTEKDKTYDAHLRFIIKDSKLYAVILIGGDKAAFNDFANSLRFN